MTPSDRIVRKVWGTEFIITNSDRYCSKRLVVKPGFRCSWHRHPVKHETFFVESGHGWIIVDGEPYEALPGVIVEVEPQSWHVFWAIGDAPLVLLETSTHHSDEDVEREYPSARLRQPVRLPVEALEFTT